MRAEAAGDPGPWRQQALLGRDRWDAEALRDLVRDYVIEHLADTDAVLVASGVWAMAVPPRAAAMTTATPPARYLRKLLLLRGMSSGVRGARAALHGGALPMHEQ